MSEAVRLVIWDLDETFWRGTLTEGGIEYIQAHHEIVVELARRGIMSSICSKNDATPVLDILREKGLLDYIIFPSISWDPKGPRLAAQIEAIQLRPATVMFIDDNHLNRAEAAAIVPELQVEDETFIERLLDDQRFKGKDDRALTRLAQYKLLETRKQDELQAAGDNEGFLRGCDIRVYVEYDVLAHLDRAIELINRTNQLNFTKQRLPEDIEAARAELTRQVTTRGRQSGLIRVMDRYGDYGFVGFFMTENLPIDLKNATFAQMLLHYCFSCRTLGMLVEQWFYERLQRPRIKVIGEVLTDLSIPRTIDWIRAVPSMDADASAKVAIAPEIRIHGGCEAQSVAHYLGTYTDTVTCSANFFAGAYFVRMNGAALLMSACDRRTPAFRDEAEALHIPYETLVSSYFDTAPTGTLFVLGTQWDANGQRYCHKVHGWQIRLEQNDIGAGLDLVRATDAELAAGLAKLDNRPEKRELVAAVSQHVREHYESLRHPDPELLTEQMRLVFERVPVGSKLLMVLDHVMFRGGNGLVRLAPWVQSYNEQIARIVAPYPYVGTICFGDFIENDDEILLGGNHYERAVYHRMAEGIAAAAARLVPKGETATQLAAE